MIFRSFTADAAEKEASSTESGMISFDYVMTNVFLDPEYCIDYVAEAFSFALCYGTSEACESASQF